jgi:hypothetical protein
MFLCDYSKSTFSLGDAQFAISIALDSLKEKEAAKAIMFFASVSLYEKLGVDAVQKERDIARDYIKNATKTTKNGKEVKVGTVAAAIDYFWNHEVLMSRVSMSRTHESTRKTSLGSMVRITEEILYRETMKVLFHYSANKLIVAYMHTKMFHVEFVNAVRRFLSSRGRGAFSRPAPSTIDELLAGFIRFVDNNCSNGQYDNETANPDAYLIRNSAGGPFIWYCNGKNGEFYKILNRKGHNTSIGGKDGDFTIMDAASIESRGSEHHINFVNVCTKINSASRLLFTHNNDLSAVYDIFSHYRDRMQAETIQKFGSFNILGCRVTATDDRTLDADCSEVTVRDKLNGRMFICELFINEFSKGIRKEEIYNKLYLPIVRGTSLQPKKNGVRLFETSDYRPKKGNLSNSEKFQILFDGYAALFEFLAFLDSQNNSRGLSLGEIPVEIFRVAALLKRFRSFEEYIDYGSDVYRLYLETDRSPDGRKEIADGFLSNDVVYDILARQKILRSDPVLSQLLQVEMSVFTAAVDRHRGDSQQEKLIGQCYDISSAMRYTVVDVSNLKKCSIDDLEKFMYCESKNIVDKYQFVTATSWEMFVDACRYAGFLKLALEREGTPVINFYGFYQPEAATLLEEVSIPDEFAEKYSKEVVRKILLTRAMAVQICMSVFVGTARPQQISDINMKWKDYRNFWCICGMLFSYFDRAVKSLGVLGSLKKKDAYLMNVIAASNEDFLRVNAIITDFTELQLFIGNQDLAKCLVSGNNTEQFSQEKQQLMLIAYNRLMRLQGSWCEVFETLLQMSSATFSRMPAEYRGDSYVEDMLVRADISIRSTVLTDPGNRRISQYLFAHFDVDREGYVLTNSSRYRNSDGLYVHSAGFAVDVGEPGLRGMSIKMLTNEILSKLLSDSQIDLL